MNATRNDILTFSADDLMVIKWYVDVAFAVHAFLLASYYAIFHFNRAYLFGNAAGNMGTGRQCNLDYLTKNLYLSWKR